MRIWLADMAHTSMLEPSSEALSSLSMYMRNHEDISSDNFKFIASSRFLVHATAGASVQGPKLQGAV